MRKCVTLFALLAVQVPGMVTFAMPNYCATNFTDLAQRARRNLRSMQRRATLVSAFWKQAELF